jgi:cytochrome c5
MLLLASACSTMSTPSTPSLQPDLQAKYDANCATCHEAGAADAPRRGDVEDFGLRLGLRGVDGLVASVRQGTFAMPPRGLCYTCSDDDLQALVQYLLQPR